MSGTVTTINTPVVGTTGTPAVGSGDPGGGGGMATDSGPPFSDENVATLGSDLLLRPEVTGGAGAAFTARICH
jgi:hypothetical protein